MLKWFVIVFTIITATSAFTPALAQTVSPNIAEFKLQYILPVEPDVDFSSITHSFDWQNSADGWIKEDLFQASFWLGKTPKVAWLKLNLEPTTSQAHPLWVELASSGVTRASIYFKDSDNQWQSINSDDLAANAQDSIRTRFISFQLHQSWQQHPIYLRVESSYKFHLQFNLKTNHQIINQNSQVNFIYAIGYGILLVMALYNAVIGRFLKDSLYYIYSAAIGTTLLYQFFAHAHSRLFFSLNWDHVNYWLNFLAMLIAALPMLFLYHFANFNFYAPRVAKWFRHLLKALALVTFASLLLPPNMALNLVFLIAGPMPLVALAFAAWAWYRGSKAAAIFMLAWSIYIIGGFTWLNYWLGLISLNNAVELPLIIGAALESILLSLALGYRIQLMSEQTSLLEQSKSHYKKISMLDSLTQLANRRAFDSKLAALRSSNSQYGLMLLDIDHFKKFNDTYGHLAGDSVIAKLAEILSAMVREDDMAARIGGEEFALISHKVNLQKIHIIAERIRQRFNDTVFEVKGSKVNCSVSIGISVAQLDEDSQVLIERTDQALYRAKTSGRNQINQAELLPST